MGGAGIHRGDGVGVSVGVSDVVAVVEGVPFADFWLPAYKNIGAINPTKKNVIKKLYFTKFIFLNY
jgi:hypothetical protein